MANELYERFKAMGVDVSWYERAKGNAPRTDDKAPIPLNDDHCGMLSIYLLEKSGKMFTLTTNGEQYQQVRKVKSIARNIYLCACCKQQFPTYTAAAKHYEGGNSAEANTNQTDDEATA
jgi:hypothetical protein